MAQSMTLPAAVTLVGLAAVLFLELPHHLRESEAARDAARQGGA